MNPRQRRGLLLLVLSGLGLLAVFVLIASYVADVRTEVDPKIKLLALSKPVKAFESIPDDAVTEITMPRALGAGDRAAQPLRSSSARVAGTDLTKDSLLQADMLIAPPELAPGQREVAILVDAETGVAGKIGPGSVVDIVAPSRATRSAASSRGRPSSSPAARVIEVGQAQLKGGRGVQQAESDPTQVVPVTFALTPKEQLRVTEAESFAQEVRLALRRPGDDDPAEEGRADLHATRAAMTQHRLLLAIADAELAQSASALAREGEELQVVDRGRRRRGGWRARCAGSRSTSSSCTTRSARCRCSRSRATSPRASPRSASC